MEKYVRGIHAMLVATRARDLMTVVGNARTPADVNPENPTLLKFKAAMEIALEELSDIEDFIAKHPNGFGAKQPQGLL